MDVNHSKTVEEKPFAFEPKRGILAQINQTFHEDYNKLIAQITSTFGKPEGSTVLLFTSKNLIIHHNGTRKEEEFIPTIYHQLKAIQHHPVTLYATLETFEGQRITHSLRDFLKERSNLLQEASSSLNEQDWPENVIVNQKLLIADSVEYINQVLTKECINSEELSNYVRKVTPKIIQGVNHAAFAQLEFIHEKLKNIIAKEISQSLYVVVCQAHQARHGELVTQYFERVFNEFQRDAGAQEDRIVFRESDIDDEPGSLRLLASHILDQKISSAFFREPKRLQSDVLKDAVNFWLWEHTMDIPKWR